MRTSAVTAELQELADRYLQLTNDAVSACASGDVSFLATLLDGRQIVVDRAAELSRELAGLRLGLTPRSSSVVAASMRDALVRLEQAQLREADLLRDAQLQRGEIGRQLSRLRADAAGSAAYGRAMARTNVDVTR